MTRDDATALRAGRSPSERAPRSAAIGDLRAFVVLLVVAHHSVMAYRPYAPPPPVSLAAPPMAWLAVPVVDEARWLGFEVLLAFNDVFFMSLLFFVSGLFVWPSLTRKGPTRFARDRTIRLGIPFVVAAAVLGPLAYYPAYLQSGAPAGSFRTEWTALPHWPSGPVWFLWVLLAFDLVAAAARAVAPGWGDALGRLAARVRTPGRSFCWLLAVSAVAYLPAALLFGAGAWVQVGPFALQASRPLLYAVYFLAGVAVGARGIDRGLLARDGALARRWPAWAGAALVAFLVALLLLAATALPESRGEPTRPALRLAAGLVFVVSCAASSFAVLAAFVRFARGRGPLAALSPDAYGIFVVHFALVSWLQYALVGVALPALAKGMLVFAAAVLLSWAATAALRRIPAVARVL